MSVHVHPFADLGLVTIAPPAGAGDVTGAPRTRLRVPVALGIKTEPIGEGAEYSPVLGLELNVGLIDRTIGPLPFAEQWPRGQPDVPRIGDWRYDVYKLITVAQNGPVTPASLAAIRLPALLRRALRGVVLLLTDDGGYSIDPRDDDDRAITAYVTAQLISEHPTKAVAAELGINANAAAQRVYRLRAAGRLPAVPKKGTSPWATEPSPYANSTRAAGKPARPVPIRPHSTATTKPRRGASSSSSPAPAASPRRRARPG